MPSMKINGTPVELRPAPRFSTPRARRASISPPFAGIPSSPPGGVFPASAWSRWMGRASSRRPATPRPQRECRSRPSRPRPGTTGRAFSSSCWNGTPASTSKMAAGRRRETCSRSTWYGTAHTPRKSATLSLRHGDERPGDPMIQHDMRICILCTRCVRACEDIQVVGVLDMAHRGDHAEIIVGGDGNPDNAGCTWCGECVRSCPTGRDLRVHRASAVCSRAARPRPGDEAASAPTAVSGARSTCRCGRPDRACREPRYRGSPAQPRFDMRQGPVRQRLRAAPGPAGGTARSGGDG